MKNQEDTTNYVRQWKQIHREAGLCIYCRQEAIAGSVVCEYHRDYFREYKKRKKVS